MHARLHLGNIEGLGSTKHTDFPIRKYMKYFINFLKNVKSNSVHNVIHKTFAVFGSPKVACSRDRVCDFFRYSPVNNTLSLSRGHAREII